MKHFGRKDQLIWTNGFKRCSNSFEQRFNGGKIRIILKDIRNLDEINESHEAIDFEEHFQV